jgi:signal transduction histidine kinase
LKPKLVVIFLLMVLVPLGLVVWLGLRVARYEQEAVRDRFSELLLQELFEVDRTIAQFMQQRQSDLLALIDAESPDVESLRNVTRSTPFVRQTFYLDTAGRILFPSPSDQLSQGEWDFLQRTKDILIDKNLIHQSQDRPVERTSQKASPPTRPQQRQAGQSVRQAPGQAESGSQPTRTHGWYAWYWGRGIQVLFWRKDTSGNIIGAELDSARLLADVIALLPNTDPTATYPLHGRIALCNALDEAVYQWGKYESGPDQQPVVTRPLQYPLNAWTLKYYLPPEQIAALGGFGTYLSLAAAVVAVGLALAGLAVYFYRETTRQMREAAQRVSFVNHVSHELKTPLTNIRMYAELLDAGLSDEEQNVRRRLDVIVSESQRLSRLIGNILSFSRKQRHELALHLRPDVVDEVVEAVLEHFRPSLKTHGIDVTLDARARQPVQLDRDALEQILGNLFNNVEKYAAAGGTLRVTTRQQNGHTVVTVADRGPGIPPAQRERIFLPFHRVSSRLTDGVAGTGIGLSIARDLARLHGGDLVVLPTDEGAAFELRIATPPAPEGETP